MAANASAQLAGIASRLESMSKTWKLEVARTLRDEVKDKAIPAVQKAAREQLPHAGGLNEHVADQLISVSAGLSARGSYVRMRQPYFDAKQTDRGYVRHPTFGEWLPGTKSQQIPQAAGWWSKTLEALGPEVTARLLTVISEFNDAMRLL